MRRCFLAGRGLFFQEMGRRGQAGRGTREEGGRTGVKEGQEVPEAPRGYVRAGRDCCGVSFKTVAILF